MLMMRSKRGTTDCAAVARAKAWTRQGFALGADRMIFIAAVACGLPGCPPVESVIALWMAPDRRYGFKVFKPIEAVVGNDLPPSWMKDAIIADEPADCC
jgi:hypothetical protein